MTLNASFTRLGIVLAPSNSDTERNGITNPASARTRNGALVLFPRAVAGGNVSRIVRCVAVWSGDTVTFERDGFALQPNEPYERRTTPGGYGCEDPRITFVPTLDRYLMAYCAFGPDGARVALATSTDAREWTRMGLIDFHGLEGFGDKDAAFFPEIVNSPSGVPSFALLHRPTLHASVAQGRAMVTEMLARPPSERESICIAYVAADAVRADIRALLSIHEKSVILRPDGAWGAIKVGAGTPPVRTNAGWMLLYHGIDVLPGSENTERPALQYRAGIAVLDLVDPQLVTYRSPTPILAPETPQERKGQVDEVVFPTAIDPRPDIARDAFDIYYGAADAMIGRGRLRLGEIATGS